MAPAVPDSDETRRLLQEARDGDARAIDRLLERHRPYVLGFVQLRLDPQLRARVDPSDVVQEAQLEAVRRMEAYLSEPALPFRLWLRQLAYDRLLMLRRRHLGAKRRSVARDVPLPDRSSALLAERLLADDASPSEHLARRELARRVRMALARLPEADREIVLMRNFEGLTNQETAQLLDIEPAAASQRYGRALLRLRKLLLEERP